MDVKTSNLLIQFVPGERLKVKLIGNSGFFRGFVIRAENAKVKDGLGKLYEVTHCC